jgi:Rps23 Pro-64 3,4-dihydroxylase Tpa1-like proline 4-hydroxylase
MIAIRSKYAASDLRAELKQRYLAAIPFQHLVLDDVFSEGDLDPVVAEFAQARHNGHYNDPTTQKKFSCDDWDLFPPRTLDLISYLNSAPFLRFLVDVTGITELTSDPYLHGGGMHETFPGGFLKMHTDFNFHKILKLDRRINAILFLNRDWAPAWKGELVLSDKSMTHPINVAPIFNRLVIFNTNDHSFHGQPDPHTFPADNSRKSIAMYYYSNGRPKDEITSHKIGTSYRVRHRGDFPMHERLRDIARTLLGRKRPR